MKEQMIILWICMIYFIVMVILNYVFIIFVFVTIIEYINFDCIILAPPKILVKIRRCSP